MFYVCYVGCKVLSDYLKTLWLEMHLELHDLTEAVLSHENLHRDQQSEIIIKYYMHAKYEHAHTDYYNKSHLKQSLYMLLSKIIFNLLI